MVVLALLLIAASLAFGAGVLLGVDRTTTLDVFGVQVRSSENGLFLLGAATLLALLVGLWLLRAALRRARRRRTEVRELRRIAAQAPPPSHVSPAPGRATLREEATATGATAPRLGKDPVGRDTAGEGTTTRPVTGWEGERNG